MIPIYTIILGVMAGISLITGLNNLLINFTKKKDKTMLMFSLMCFNAFFYFIFIIIYYNTPEIDNSIIFSKLYNLFAYYYFISFMWFIAIYTKYFIKPLLITITLFYFFNTFLTFYLPGGAIFSTLEIIKQINFSWRETIFIINGKLSIFRYINFFLYYIIFFYAFIAIRKMSKIKYNPLNRYLLLSIVVFYIILTYDTIVEFLYLDFIVLADLGTIFLIAFMNIYLFHQAILKENVEEELHDTERKLNAIFDNSTEYIGLLNTNGLFLKVNKTALKSIDSTEKDLIGKYFWETAWWKDASKDEITNIKNKIKEASQGKKVRFDHKYSISIHKFRYMDSNFNPVFDNEGKVIYIIAEGRDITPQILAIERNKRVSNIFNNIQTGMYIYKLENINDDKSLRLIAANPASEKLTGLKPENIVGKTIDDIFPNLRKKEIPQNYANVIRKGNPFELEDIIYNDDRIPEAAFSVKAFQLPDNMLGVAFENITKRKFAEDELLKAKLLLSTAIKESQAGIIIADAPDVNISIINSAALNIRGETNYQLDNIPFELHPVNWQVYKPDDTLCEPDDLPLTRAVLYGETSKNIELYIKQLNGDKRWIISNASPVKDLDGKIIAGIVVFLDITDRKEMEFALKNSEERYKMLFNMGTDAIFVHSLLKNKLPGKFVEVNKVACDIYEYSRDEFLQISPLEIEDPDSGLDIKKTLNDLITNNYALFNQTLITKSGKKIYVEINSCLFDYNGEEFIFSIARDITERKRMQDMMIQTEKMMSVGGLAAGMAHEINNPLSIILQNVSMIKQRISKDIKPNIKAASEIGLELEKINEYFEKREINQYLDWITKSGERAASIVRDMLSFSRKSDRKKSSNNIPDLLDKTISIVSKDYDLNKKYDFRSITITKDYEKDCPLIICNSQEIQQVFLNILSNGAQAMFLQKNNNKYSSFHLKVYLQNNNLIIEITDNGPGMPDNVKNKIFEPFYTTKEEGMGTGLGLSVCYFIIKEKHKGRIEVESEINKGTKFIIELPIN